MKVSTACMRRSAAGRVCAVRQPVVPAGINGYGFSQSTLGCIPCANTLAW
jgi:hypothetical protein